MRFLAWSVLILFAFSSGCLFGGNATNTAEQLSGVRDAYISAGLLVPVSSSVREQYRNEILPFRNTINSIGGNDSAALKAYLNGSLSLLEMANATDTALNLLKNVNMDAPDCGKNSPMGKAIVLLEQAQKSAESAHSDFVTVQGNSIMANALGADYILNAAQTSDAVAQTHSERIKELKTACGFSV